MTQKGMERYTLEDFKIICQNGFDYHISDDTLDIISALASQVGAPDYIKTPKFNSNTIGRGERGGSGDMFERGSGGGRDRNRHGGGRRRRRQQEMTDDDWEDLRTFHTKQKAEISPEKALEKQYRGELNKLVSSSDKEQLSRLATLFKQYHETRNDNRAETLFFDVATCSKINTKLFADVLCELIQNDKQIDRWMEDELMMFIEDKWLYSFETIECISEDEDYDKFCDSNRVNEIRLNSSMFLGNFFHYVVKHNMDDFFWTDTINRAVSTIFNQFETELMKDDNEDVAFVCCSNIFAFLVPILDVIGADMDEVDDDLSKVEYVKMRLLEIVDDEEKYPSLTRKIVFVIQDNKIWL